LKSLLFSILFSLAVFYFYFYFFLFKDTSNLWLTDFQSKRADLFCAILGGADVIIKDWNVRLRKFDAILSGQNSSLSLQNLYLRSVFSTSIQYNVSEVTVSATILEILKLSSTPCSAPTFHFNCKG
jgi:hypothetical protein